METEMLTLNDNEIHCKVQYGNEFRRFVLQDSYAALLSQIRRIFGFKDNDEVGIKYTDDEGDLVTISSDEELAFAIEMFPNSVLRLTITASISKSSQCSGWSRQNKWCQRGEKTEGGCGKWSQSNGCGKWNKDSGCGKWAKKNANKDCSDGGCGKWGKKAEKYDCSAWKQKKANKWCQKGEGGCGKWEAKKGCNWEEKMLNNPEQRKEKLERVEKKLQKLQDRKQWLQTKAAENNNSGCYTHRLDRVNAKINRVSSVRTKLSEGPNPASTTTGTSVTEPLYPLL